MEEKLSSSKSISAAFLATSDPEPIAIPISAFLIKMLFSEQITVDDDTSGLGPGDILVHTEFLNHVVEFSLWVLDNVDFVSNSSGSWWLITSDHDNFDTGRSALGDGQIDSWSWWIVEGNDTDEAEVV